MARKCKYLDIRSFYATIINIEGDDTNISKDIKPITYLKSKAPDLLKQINKTHRPVVITQNGESKAVLQGPESYQNMRNATGIMKLISQGEQDVKDGRLKNQEEVCKGRKGIEQKNEMKKIYHDRRAEIAEKDLLATVKYIADDSPSRAYEVFKELRKEAQSIHAFPGRGRIVSEFQEQGITQCHELIVNQRRITYRTSERTVYILSVFDSLRSIEGILCGGLQDSSCKTANKSLGSGLKSATHPRRQQITTGGTDHEKI